jgi:hypothetical protein
MTELELSRKQIIEEMISCTLSAILYGDFDAAEDHLQTARTIHARNVLAEQHQKGETADD